MRVPLIGILSSVSAALGIYGLVWYHRLSKAEQEEADRLSAEYAMKLYNKGLHELTSQQMSWVHDLVKGRMAS